MPGVVVRRQRPARGDARGRARPRPRARRGEGPTLLEFKTFRMRGHEEASGTDYVPAALFEEWAAKDPLLRFERVARRARRAGRRASARRCAPTIKDEIDRAGGRGARRSPIRLDRGDRAGGRLRAAAAARADGAGRGGRRRARASCAIVDAISDGLREAMRADDRGRPDRAGHRGVRRRLQGHGGVRRGVRQGARAQHADHRVGRDRRGARAGARRLPADGRDAVRRLHLLRLQPDRQQPRQDALPLGRGRAGRAARARRRRHRARARSTRRTSRRGSRTSPG